MKKLISRHGKVYVRDRVALFMSFLSVIILIVVYQVFLGDLQLDNIKRAMGVETVSSNVVKMVNLWLISGLTIIVSMTSTLGAFSVMILDKEKKIDEDLLITPLSKVKIELSYSVFAVIFGIIITCFACLFGIIIFNVLAK